jgi:hypothetical protein
LDSGFHYRHPDHLTGQARIQAFNRGLLPVVDGLLIHAPRELFAVMAENSLTVSRVPS